MKNKMWKLDDFVVWKINIIQKAKHMKNKNEVLDFMADTILKNNKEEYREELERGVRYYED